MDKRLKTIRAAHFRHTVYYEEPKKRTGDHGESILDWENCERSDKLKAAVIPLSGNELVLARQLVGNATYRVECRWIDAQLNGRIRTEDGKELYIGHHENVEERRILSVLTCAEEVTADVC